MWTKVRHNETSCRLDESMASIRFVRQVDVFYWCDNRVQSKNLLDEHNRNTSRNNNGNLQEKQCLILYQMLIGTIIPGLLGNNLLCRRGE